MDFLTATLFEGLPIQFTVWEVIYTMILFLVLAFILNRFLFQPVLAVLDARERRFSASQGATDESARVKRSWARGFWPLALLLWESVRRGPPGRAAWKPSLRSPVSGPVPFRSRSEHLDQ